MDGLNINSQVESNDIKLQLMPPSSFENNVVTNKHDFKDCNTLKEVIKYFILKM